MRLFLSMILLGFLTACGVAPTDIAIGSAMTYALFGDDLEEVKKEDLEKLEPSDIRKLPPPQAKHTARRLADHVRDNVRTTTRHVKKWWFYDPAAVPVAERETPNSYCYRARGDVLCYSQPMPGWEGRLIGYQGTHAMLPPKTIVELLPKNRLASAKSSDHGAEKAKPVFAAIPAVTEEASKDEDPNAEVKESLHEPIADPRISPQF